MTITSVPAGLDLEAWKRFTDDHEERHELVRGIPVVSPTESNRNADAAFNLALILRTALGPGWKALPHMEVNVGPAGEPLTLRVPDVILVPRDIDPSAHRDPASVVRLAAEIVSPSSVETDWLVKREEYAAAGIPAYLVVDPRGDVPRMALFDRIVDGRYADPAPDGTRATLTVDGVPVDLRLDDILAW